MTRGPLGDSLYLGVIWRQVMNETPAAASVADAIRPENLSRPDSRTVPSLCPVIEGSHLTEASDTSFVVSPWILR
jgi:hypothetical protein